MLLHYSDHISTEGGHAEHVLVTRISNKMDDSSTDKQIFEFSKCPRSVEFRAAIYIVVLPAKGHSRARRS